MTIPTLREDFSEVWRAAADYMRSRKNDVHVPISFDFAQRLLAEHPEADATVVSLAIILHDIGWHSIDNDTILENAFGPNMMQSEVRFLHEKEGARLARPLLVQLGYSAPVIDEICQIIDGHDTRPEALSLNDSLVKDADKLWRYTTTGVAVACDWFKMSPSAYMDRIEKQLGQLFSDASVRIAGEELRHSRRILMAEIL